MQYKPFPSEKRAYILQKPFEEFEQFFQELSPTEQGRLTTSLPPLRTGGFRPHRPERRKMQLRRLRGIAKNPEHPHHLLAWNIFEGVWQAWIGSHPELRTLLEHYDNSDDFHDDEPKHPNTYLDIECFKYLTHASFNNIISQEVIKKFYEFGYFKQENIISSYIHLAHSIHDIAKNKNMSSSLEMIENIQHDIASLHKKSAEIIKIHEDMQNKVSDFESILSQQKNDLIIKIEDLSLHLLGTDNIEKRLIRVEDVTKTIEHVCESQQQNTKSISNECTAQLRDMQEYLELLGTTVDEHSHNMAELHASYHQLVSNTVSASELTPGAYTHSSLVPGTPKKISALVSPTTLPILDGHIFLQHRLLPALAAWMPEMTLLWAELFHHALQVCRWVLIPNPAWGLAYHEAMGGTANIQVVQVEPTWLVFADAWKGAVEQCWMAAYQRPERLHLLLLEDVNRALPECWGRPWLDLLAGFREVLPVAEPCGWPENLRILSCPATDKATLPLSQTVVQHWAAVSLPSVGVAPTSPPITREGHVPWDTWKAWGMQDMDEKTSTVSPLYHGETRVHTKEFGPLARSVTRDLHRLETSLQRLAPQREVTQTVRNIRITWPEEYLQLTDDTDE